LILASDEPIRFHAALSIAAASAAAGATTRLFLHGDAAGLLACPVSSPEDGRYRAAGLPTLAQMLDEALTLGVILICCQSGLALAGLAADALDSRIEVGGLVGLLTALGDDRLVAV
jgi:predicted peroxiredoxin